MTTMGWEHLTAPDLTGRTVVMTGASDGLGREAALELARWGARLILPVRNRDKGEVVRDRLRRETGRGDVVELVHLDLADLSSVRTAAGEIERLAGADGIPDLVSVAGAITRRREETVDGFERMMGVNALAPMLLVETLLPRVSGRVVLVTSNAHRSGRIDLGDPHFRRTRWSVFGAYGRSKLTEMLWGLDLASRMPAGTDLQLVHPGWVLTNLQNATGHDRIDRFVTTTTRPVAMTAAQGADQVLFALTQPLPNGSYVGPDGLRHLWGRPTLIPRSDTALDRDLAREVVEWMRAEVGLG